MWAEESHSLPWFQFPRCKMKRLWDGMMTCYMDLIMEVVARDQSSLVSKRSTVLVVGWIIAPKSVHVLLLRTCEYITSHDKKDFKDVINLRILKWRDYSELSGWVQHNQKDPYRWKKEEGGSESERRCNYWGWSNVIAGTTSQGNQAATGN